MPDPLKLDSLYPHFGHGFEKGFAMSITLVVRGIEVLVFMHNLTVYVMLPHDDLEAKDIVVRSEKDILSELREEFGREIKDVRLVQVYVH